MEELRANSSRLVHGIGVGEVVTNNTGVIVRRVSQAKLKYLDFILRGSDMIRSEFPNRLEKIRLRTGKTIF